MNSEAYSCSFTVHYWQGWSVEKGHSRLKATLDGQKWNIEIQKGHADKAHVLKCARQCLNLFSEYTPAHTPQ